MKYFLFLSISMIAALSCSIGEDAQLNGAYGIFSIVDDNTVEMDGEIGSSTLENFNDLIAAYPNVEIINLKEVPGSGDDDINLQVSTRVHELGIATHLVDGGLIASGGVDFFLAGTTRTRGNNTMIGVHAWTDGRNEATDYPVGDSNHQPYIDYYQTIGFTQSEAEAFYYFTINAAASSSLHYMTDSEVAQYGILKP